MKNTDFNITTNIDDMYGFCGYLSQNGEFYKEKPLYELGTIEGDLFAWNLLKYIKSNETPKEKKKLELLRSQLKEAFGNADHILEEDYGFIRINDLFRIVTFSCNLNKISDIQKEIILELQNRYFNKNNTLKR